MVAGLQTVQIRRHNHDGIHQRTKRFFAIADILPSELIADCDHFLNHESSALQHQCLEGVL